MMPRKSRRKHVLLTVTAAALLGGCGGDTSWMEADPWPRFENRREQAEMQQVAGPPDILESTPPIQMKQGGTLGALGVNLKTYFAPDIEDPQERIRRVERAMVALQRDLRIMAGPAQRLAEIESELKTIAAEVERRKQAQEAAPAAAPPEPLVAGRPAPKPPAQAEKGTPVTRGPRTVEQTDTGPAVISGIRVGEHPEKVRVVFDVTKQTSYRADLDNQENLLVVEMPNARWKTPVEHESFKNMPVLKSYTVEDFNDGQGHIVVLQLKKPTKIAMQAVYPALAGQGKRIVIDLKK